MTQSSVGLWSSPLWGQHEVGHVSLLTPSRVTHVLCHLMWQEIKERKLWNKYSNFSHPLCGSVTWQPTTNYIWEAPAVSSYTRATKLHTFLRGRTSIPHDKVVSAWPVVEGKWTRDCWGFTKLRYLWVFALVLGSNTESILYLSLNVKIL